MTTVLTAGYQMRSLADFVAQLSAARVDVVLDVRETPWSQRREFSRSSLEVALELAGIHYVHAWFAGNPKENRASAASHRECLERYAEYLDDVPDVIDILEELVMDIANSGGSRICLVCYERHPDDCHRSILLTRWRARGAEIVIEHIAPDGAPRFLS